LWVADGTPADTKMLADINAGAFSSSPSNFTPFGQGIVFAANTNNNGVELWKADGTGPGTALLKDINTTATAFSFPTLFTNLSDTINGKLFFWAFDGIHGNELWATDGTGEGTAIVKDIWPGETSADGAQFYYPASYSPGVRLPITSRLNGYDYFFANSGNNGYELWKTQGTPGSTSFVSSIPGDSKTLSPQRIGATKNYIFLIVSGAASGSKLYRCNATGEMTLIKDSFNLTFGRSERNMINVGEKMYFFVSPGHDDDGIELWQSDGTVAGTKAVKKLYAGQEGAFSTNLIAYKNELFFGANSGFGTPSSTDFKGRTGYLWKSDGTAEGTVMLSKAAMDEVPMTIANDKLYFIADDGVSGRELWVTNGTENGTHLVKDIAAGANSADAYPQVDFKGNLYFSANDGSGQGIWKTDGTEAGTVLVIHGPYGCINGDGTLYFTDAYKIWSSDGTTAGTKLIYSSALEGVDGFTNLAYLNGKLYFIGYNKKYGQEIYVTTQSLLPVSLLSFKGHWQGENAFLQWATINEQRNNYFNVQRSYNGVDFTTISKVFAKAGTKENDYNYTDANFNAAVTGKLYYRLQQVDVDGKFNYSNTIVLDVTTGSRLKISPNPAVNFAYLYSTVNMPNALIQLVDINGRIIYSAKQNIPAGSNVTIPLQGYAKGMYTITVQSAGRQRQELKLVVR
jgi:ELWxxDGT repeat protein